MATWSTASRRAPAPAGCTRGWPAWTSRRRRGSEVESLLEQQPGSIPALDIVVDDFELKGRKLGRLEIDAVNRGPGRSRARAASASGASTSSRLTMPEASFTAIGQLGRGRRAAGRARRPRPRRAGERRRTVLKFRLDIADAGQLLSRFGMRDVVRRGRGPMEGTVSWVGSPLAFDYPSMTGSFNVNVEAGQFLKADPGWPSCWAC